MLSSLKKFQKDKYAFNIIFKIFQSPNLEFNSDDENYLICRGNKELPTWIWTKDGIDNEKVFEIEKLIENYLLDEKKTKFAAKKELYELLVERKFSFLDSESYFEMGLLICRAAKKPKVADGKMIKPSEKDRAIIEEYLYNFKKELKDIADISKEEAQKEIEELFRSDQLYLWQNKTGKIVCIGSYNVIDNQGKISHVYTPVAERKKGYGANLIFQITNKLLEEGLVPLLYVDNDDIAAIKCYTNVGYEKEGTLINFSCSKKNKF